MTTSATTAALEDRLVGDRLFVLVLCYVAFVVLGLLDGMTGVAFALMRTEFGVGLDAMAAILVPSTAGFLISSFFVGRVLNRTTMALLLVAAGSLRSLALGVISVAPEWWMVSATAFVLGMGSGLIDAGMNTWFAIRFSPKLMNWLHACFGVGATVGPVILTALLALGFTWRTGFAFMLAGQVAVVLLAWFTRSRWRIAPLPESTLAARTDGHAHADSAPDAARAAAQPVHAAEAPVRETLRIPAVWVGIAVFFFYTGVELTTGNWGFTIFTEARGIDVRTAGIFVSFFWGSFALGRIVFGFVTVRSLPMLLRTVLLSALAGALLMTLGRAAWTQLAAVVIIGFALAPVFPLLVSETPARLGRAHAQHAIGFQVGAASLGIAVLPSLAGAIAEATSPAIIPWFLVIVAVVLIALHELLVHMHAQ